VKQATPLLLAGLKMLKGKGRTPAASAIIMLAAGGGWLVKVRNVAEHKNLQKGD